MEMFLLHDKNKETFSLIDKTVLAKHIITLK